ncbi:MAG: hypothetical protein Q7S29_04035 [Candidatus Peribacter sp.]|nr:hypothetical protein [Candidatus Peribacter sp.]
MSISVLPEAPDIIRSRVTPNASLPPDQLGRYSVGDPAFIRQATATLVQRCVLRGCALPQHVVSSLQLVNGDCNAIGMANALLAMTDLEQRRAVVCDIVHEIVRLK